MTVRTRTIMWYARNDRKDYCVAFWKWPEGLQLICVSIEITVRTGTNMWYAGNGRKDGNYIMQNARNGRMEWN